MLALLLAIACADPAKDKSAATVAEPTPAPAAPAAPATSGETVAAAGTIGWIGAKVTKSHEGSFGTWTGTFTVDGNELKGVKFEVRTDSVTTDSPKLIEHLKSADFFDVATHPTATFSSVAVTPGAPADSKLAGATHTVEGDLTLRGVTKRITFPAVVAVGAGDVKASTEFSINRKDFKIEYPGKPDDLIRDDVLMKIDLTGTRTAAAPAAAAPATADAAAPATNP